nr:chaperone DnaJ-domain superfamily protein [Tanacetum cinerariifolium]
MARKGNQQKNGLDGSTSNNKKGGLQSGSATLNKKGKGSVGNTKAVKEELPSDTQPSISVTEVLKKPDHVKDEKKRTNKSGKHNKVEIQGTSSTSAAEHLEPWDSTPEDCCENMSTTGSSRLEEEKWASTNGIPRFKNRKRSSGHSMNGYDADGLRESVELPETLGVQCLKTFVSSVSQASIEWLDRHKPLFGMLLIKTLIARDYVRMKIKHAYPIILSIFTVVAMMGMLKFITVGAIVVLVALFVGFTIGLLLLAVSGIVFLWLYGSFWTTLAVLIIGGITFMLSHERLALLVMTLYSVYSAWTLVGWLGIIVAFNLSFFSSDALIFFVKNNVHEHRRSNSVPEQTPGMQSGPAVHNGEEARSSSTDGGTIPPADRGSGIPSTSGSDADLTSEDEVVRLLNSADHYSALGLSRFQEIDATFLKREYRKKAMLVHPDKNMGNEKAAEAFKKLQNAYEVLLDASKQKTYDDELRREDLLNYFRRFQNATPKNKRNGFFGSTFGGTEVHVDDPLGESRRIACQRCGGFHMWFYTNKAKSKARSCQDCKDCHPAKDGDGWVEQSSQPLLFGVFQKVDPPHAYVCADSKIYDATEWYLCQGMRCPANTHKPSFHVNTSVMSRHNNGKGPTSSHRGGGGIPNIDETMTEEEFMEWVQNAVQSGMFDNFGANGGPETPPNSSKNGSASNGGGAGGSNSSKRKKKGKKW